MYSNQQETVVPRAGLDYEQAKDLFPERFNLNNLASILTSWKTAPTPLTTDLFADFDQKTKYYFYEHDRLLYRSTLWGVQWAEKTDARLINSLNLRLSNDGFLYPETKEIKTNRENIKRHGLTGWSLLDTGFVCTPLIHNSNSSDFPPFQRT
jgi:hypothetical protein